MAIRNETTGTVELLRDARFHRASLVADKKVAALATPVKTTETALREAAESQEATEDTRVEALAVLLRVDFDLDEVVRRAELEVLVAANKNRKAPMYLACFPKGLPAISSLRGADEARAVRALVVGLSTHVPAVARKYKRDLEALATASEEAERVWLDAEDESARAVAAEVVARTNLVRQLQKNEGTLLSMYPGERGRVRSYFRPLKRGSKRAPSAPTPPSTPPT